MTTIRRKSIVTLSPAEPSTEQASEYFAHKLAFETDPADVHHDLSHDVASFVVIDVRAAEHYEACRIPGAKHLPWGRIRESTTRDFDPDTLIVTYCWGPGCNSSTKAALRFSQLGFPVREMIGGIEYWRREGYPVEGTRGDDAPLVG